jgi:hypothetical protein
VKGKLQSNHQFAREQKQLSEMGGVKRTKKAKQISVQVVFLPHELVCSSSYK